jgi:hypothetical protein
MEEKAAEMEVLVCPHCLAENPVAAHRCGKCLTPFSSFAATDPLMSIAAEADTLGKAANAPSRPIMLIGVWMIMGPVAGFCLVEVVRFAAALWRDEMTMGACMALPIAGVFGFISIGLLIKTTHNYGRAKKERAGTIPEADGADMETAHRELEEGEEWKAEQEPQ